jgi:hypothetical protein
MITMIKQLTLSLCLAVGIALPIVTVLPAQAGSESPPPVALQQALQKFLQGHKGRLLKLEYEDDKAPLYYRIEFLDGQGILQHFRIESQKVQNLNQPVKHYPAPPANLLSLQQLLQKVFGKNAPRLLEATLKPHKAGFQYKLEWLDAQGITWEGQYDARTGRQLARKRD